MNTVGLRAISILIALMATVPMEAVALAETPAAPTQETAAVSALTQQQLDQLVAPVALYPDPLLTDILTASTYPLEVVEAQRWIADPANARLKGDALAAALEAQDWDPSVKALVPFPQILRMMDGHIDWMQSLGEAFLSQPDDVMDTAQRLRHRAESAGTLKSSPEEVVTNNDDSITIEPPPSEMIYTPSYDPWCVYGPWPYPLYAPYSFMPWPGYCDRADYLIVFDAGLYSPFDYWDWGYFDWHNRHIRIHRDRYDRYHRGHGAGAGDHAPGDDIWHHDPAHRVGVPYRDPRNIQRFQPDRDYHHAFRGYEAPQSTRPTPPAFGNFGTRRDTQTQSDRGRSSRQSIPGGPPPASGGDRSDRGDRSGGGGRDGGGGHTPRPH